MSTTLGKRRRTYESASVRPVGSGFGVYLDDKPLRTPLGTAITVPTVALAEAVAEEWRQQGTTLALDRCPLTRIAGTALDLITRQRAQVVAELAEYGETELVCHRAERPPALVARQHAVWQPLVDWTLQHFDAPLAVTPGVLPRGQSPAALSALEGAIAVEDDWRLAALAVAVRAAGSLVIGLALGEGRLDSVGAFDAAELDATFQIEAWGEDAEAARRRAGVRADLESAARFLDLLR